MKVVLIMARGVEGCGVTKWVVEQTKWLQKNGYEWRVFASADKKWSRRDSFDTSHFRELKFADEKNINDIVAACNSADLVFINCLPSKDHPEKCIAGYKKLLTEVKTKICVIQVDHNIQSIKRNAALDETIERADYIFTHSTDNDFSRYAEPILNMQSLFGNRKYIMTMQPGADSQSIRDAYWKDQSEQDVLHHKFIGRTTGWKGIEEMQLFHTAELKKFGALTTMEGLERSIGYVGFRDNFPHTYVSEDIATYNFSKQYGGELLVFGPYNNKDMMHRLSKCGFGYQLTNLKPRFIGSSMEYTHCEVASCGVIPVFNKKFGDNCMHRTQGIPLTQCKDNGTVWLDMDNTAGTIAQIEKITLDDVLRNDMREQAYEFYKFNQDAAYTFADIHSKMEKYDESDS